MMNNVVNPFEALSKIFIENQNKFNLKVEDLWKILINRMRCIL